MIILCLSFVTSMITPAYATELSEVSGGGPESDFRTEQHPRVSNVRRHTRFQRQDVAGAASPASGERKWRSEAPLRNIFNGRSCADREPHPTRKSGIWDRILPRKKSVCGISDVKLPPKYAHCQLHLWKKFWRNFGKFSLIHVNFYPNS